MDIGIAIIIGVIIYSILNPLFRWIFRVVIAKGLEQYIKELKDDIDLSELIK